MITSGVATKTLTLKETRETEITAWRKFTFALRRQCVRPSLVGSCSFRILDTHLPSTGSSTTRQGSLLCDDRTSTPLMAQARPGAQSIFSDEQYQ